MADKEIVRVERRRGGLDGPPTNAREQAAIIERDRARYVLKWRSTPNVCAQRPDSLSEEKWYGDGSAWTEERIRAALDPAVFDPAAKPKPRPRIVAEGAVVVKAGRPAEASKASTLTATKPWEKEGMSRSAWYAKQKGGDE